jgi:glucose/arabinose dehydrogenase
MIQLNNLNPNRLLLMRSFVWIILPVLLIAACSGRLDQTRPAATSTTPVTTAPVSEDTPVIASPTSLATETETPPFTDTPTDISTATNTPTSTVVQTEGFPDPGMVQWRVILSGLNAPVGLTNAGDGSGRLFIIEQAGLVRVVVDGALLPEPYLDIRERVGDERSEQGLLGLAFHPGYAQNGYLFVNYTDTQGDTVISRFQVSGSDNNRADPGSETRLLNVSQPYANHNGGAVVFGPDDFLYLGLGDGGSAGDPLSNGQSLDTLLGKILRIDVDGTAPYAIPPDNPFLDGGGRPEIWAYGLRNPWRISFDRATGDLYIGDVGQNQWEEIDFYPTGDPGGGNFGWNFFEGSHPFQGSPPSGVQLIPPVLEYGHDLGCSVTGGFVYRGDRMPAWQGIYFFADYCSGRVWGAFREPGGSWRQEFLFAGLGQVTSFGEDEIGELYLVDHNGSIYMLAER